MTREQALATLRGCERELRFQGVLHAALFGSVARGDQRPGSDVDILIELDEDRDISLFDYMGIIAYIEGLFPDPVDVVNRDWLKPAIKPMATIDAVYAF